MADNVTPDQPDPPEPEFALQRVAAELYAALTAMHSERWTDAS